MKLKHLLENSTEHAYTPLTVYEKKNMVETIKSYNEYRKGLKADGVYETAQKIMEAVNLAERYALKECGDWMEAKMVERDMKEIKRDAAKMYEEAQKMKAIEKQLEMLYEEVGRRLERYFEIADQVSEAPQSYQTQDQPSSVSIASLG
jgi:predicted nuclease with TOPRIM domain